MAGIRSRIKVLVRSILLIKTMCGMPLSLRNLKVGANVMARSITGS